MSGSIFGNVFKISTWGESHGKGLGVVIDGCPAGLLLCEADIQPDLDRRKPGNDKYATKRKEYDEIHILSGVFNGMTTGTPISLILYNADQKSEDYGTIATSYRPGHADFGFDRKFGIRDYRGGGRSSGRETAARVAAGAVAKKILGQLGVEVKAYTKAIAKIEVFDDEIDLEEAKNNRLCIPHKEKAELAALYLDKAMEELDSSGGLCECIVTGMKAGVGEPVFDKLDATLAHGLVSIGAVKGIEIGAGFKVVQMKGSENNDPLFYDEKGKMQKKTNNSGGILGGMSDGSDIVLRVAFKPTSSIFKKQQTANSKGENLEIEIEGRHDPLIVARAVVVVEAMTAITVVDEILMNMSSKLENVKLVWENMQ